VAEVVGKLGQCIVEGTEEFRDIYTTCLKGFILDTSEEFWRIIVDTVVPIMLNGMASSQS
jgi:hypothetical protein